VPIKFKPSQKTYDRRTDITTVTHYYMKNMSRIFLVEELNKEKTTPKLKQKIRNELVRRNLLSARV